MLVRSLLLVYLLPNTGCQKPCLLFVNNLVFKTTVEVSGFLALLTCYSLFELKNGFGKVKLQAWRLLEFGPANDNYKRKHIRHL